MMPAIPLQFVCALLLIIFMVRLLRRDAGPPSRLFLAMIATYALQSILYGLRWGYGVEALTPLRPLMAAIIPPLSWVGFSRLTTTGAVGRRLWLHALSPGAVVVLSLAATRLIDPVLFLIAVGYGLALVRLGRAGPDALDRVQLDGAISVQRALQVTGFVMVAEAGIDAAIAIDFVRAGGVHAAWIAGSASLMFIAVLGFAAVVAGGNAPGLVAAEPALTPAPPSMPAPPEPEDSQVIAELDVAMRTKALYRDPELSLDRLARKMAVPTRRISVAVNRVKGINVSQYVNEFRIGDACRRLAETDDSIMQIMFEVGFLTKSNFNREFLRVTGKSPSAWRAERKAAPDSKPI
jgi:AraC-like DNA-binding protein